MRTNRSSVDLDLDVFDRIDNRGRVSFSPWIFGELKKCRSVILSCRESPSVFVIQPAPLSKPLNFLNSGKGELEGTSRRHSTPVRLFEELAFAIAQPISNIRCRFFM